MKKLAIVFAVIAAGTLGIGSAVGIAFMVGAFAAPTAKQGAAAKQKQNPSDTPPTALDAEWNRFAEARKRELQVRDEEKRRDQELKYQMENDRYKMLLKASPEPPVNTKAKTAAERLAVGREYCRVGKLEEARECFALGYTQCFDEKSDILLCAEFSLRIFLVSIEPKMPKQLRADGLIMNTTFVELMRAGNAWDPDIARARSRITNDHRLLVKGR